MDPLELYLYPERFKTAYLKMVGKNFRIHVLIAGKSSCESKNSPKAKLSPKFLSSPSGRGKSLIPLNSVFLKIYPLSRKGATMKVP